MWGHDLRRVGRIDDAIAAFRRTDELERAYYAAERIDPALDWHHVHNLDLLATAYQYKGQMRRAEQTMREADALVPLTEYQEFNQKRAGALPARPRALAGRARRRASAARGPLRRRAGRGPRARGPRAAGPRARRRGARRRSRPRRRTSSRSRRSRRGLAVTRASAEPWVETLRGELLLRSGARAEGRARARGRRARRCAALPGPDAWIQALFRLEPIARAARDVGDWELAESTARQMLEHDPAYAGAHLAMALVSAHAGRTEQAERALAEARRYWQDADADLPERKQIESPSVARR